MNAEQETPQETKSSVVDLIDAIEEVVISGRRVPFSANVVVNEDDALELIDRARLGLPSELVRARHTIGEREAIIQEARAEAVAILDRVQQDAHQLMTEAETRSARMVDEHEILRTAQQRADQILAEAEEVAGSVRHDADIYARGVMEDLDSQLTRSLATVRKGLETLPKLGKKQNRH